MSANHASETYVKFDQPKRGLPDGGAILCRYCSGELEAVGETFTGVSMAGIRWFSWRHVRTQKRTCAVEYEGEPYDDWIATRKIETAERVEST